MCGIAGILDLRQRETAPLNTLRRMVERLAHRGPDDEGFYVDGFLGLAHRRLAIIDPSPAGHQPMVSADGGVAICFNGTIFNYLELRSLLQACGHRFVSKCDTEVLVHGWCEWGEGLVERLNGHFAFVAWDSRQKKLYLCRDRFGTKPLYYTNQSGLWLFASEIKAILAHPAMSPELNYDALGEYFTFQNLFRYHTLFKSVNLVPPANIIEINALSGQVKRRSYWDFDFSRPDNSIDMSVATQETQRLLTQAVRRQLLADVPVGAYLSGGVDSASIVAVAAKELEHFNTFTCGWHLEGVSGKEAAFDERAEAERISCMFNTEHFEQVVGHSDVAWALPQLVYHLEDLRLGMSYGHYYIARLASKFVKVCLSGAGGDELFGGYPWRYFRVSQSLDQGSYFTNYYDYWQRLVQDESRRDFFTEQVQRQMNGFDMKKVMTKVFTFHPGLSYHSPEDHIANSLYFEAKTFLHGLMIVGDRLSLAHGLEERAPFLDNDLVEFAQRIPVRLKLKNLEQWKRVDENELPKRQEYYALHDDGKAVLRAAISSLVPPHVRDRPKQGFSSPDENWYRGANLDFVKSLILNKRALCHDFIAPCKIQRVMDQHCSRKANHRLLIWSLINFELWLRIFLDGQQGVMPSLKQPSYSRPRSETVAFRLAS